MCPRVMLIICIYITISPDLSGSLWAFAWWDIECRQSTDKMPTGNEDELLPTNVGRGWLLAAFTATDLTAMFGGTEFDQRRNSITLTQTLSADPTSSVSTANLHDGNY